MGEQEHGRIAGIEGERRRGAVSIGLAASVGPDLVRGLAPAIEAAGFSALWVNDVPGADALPVIAAAAAATERLVVATGVLPVDRRPADEILRDVRAAGLAQSRLVLGIGSGQVKAGALDLVRRSARELAAATAAPVMVGALGPRMRRLAAEESHGPLLSWLTPGVAALQAREARRSAAGANVSLYVRTAFDPGARERLERETGRYASFPSYAANFARLGIEALDTVIAPGDDAAGRITAYAAGVDEVVLRAIVAEETPAHYRRFVDEAAEVVAFG